MGAITGVRSVNNSAVYKSLGVKTETREIRLLKIEPAKRETDPIRGTLEVVSLATFPKYAALSYVWGRKREPGEAGTRHIVHCGDFEVEVTSNCIDAIRCIRKGMSQGCERIWVDAICINEDDVKERNHQVGLMGDIYSEAHTVYAWLGKGGSLVDCGMRLLSSISRKRFFRACPFRNEPSLRQIIYDHLKSNALRLVRTDAKGDADFTHLTFSPVISQRDLQGVHELLNRTWFFRGWTFQEFMLAKNPIFLCGSNRLSWPLFRDAIEWLDKYVGCHFTRVPSYAIHRVRSTFTLCGVYDALQRRREAHSDTSFALLDNDHLGIVHALRYRDVGNPKDKSFALYGVLRSMEVNLSNPDYRKPTHIVYKELFMDLVRWRPACISLLLDAGLPAMPDSPSWVPQWDRSRIHKWMPDEEFVPKDQPDKESNPEESSPVLIITDEELHLSGRFIDEVEHAVDLSSLERHPEPELECILLLRKWLVKVKRYRKTLGAVGDMRQVLFAAVSVNRETVYGQNGNALIYYDFSRWYTIMTGQFNLDDSTRPPPAVAALPAPSSKPTKYDANNPKVVLALLKSQPLAWEFHRHICDIAKTRTIFSTRDRYIMTGPAAIRPLDRIALLSGIRVPVALRYKPCSGQYWFVGPTMMSPSLTYVKLRSERDDTIVII
ncbi:HET-domain-containing protein [Amniculicola lignicola CBS 123094]|uniref:HET-domain-containing protein n=1 Tax=Amniculicola lignicola CBS 123094 TaxID=1392246 RepID=A0A6A5WC73_9PLEO|nr:HET-domain-containing protein [Amniculicola lignicola CBS 123094]